MLYPITFNRMSHRRWITLTITAFIILLTLYSFSGHGKRHIEGFKDFVPSFVPSQPLDQPPTWARLRQWEMDLPQHNLTLPFPEGRTGRYVYFKNQIQQMGWNNQLNEVLMNSWLAYKSKRAYVFQDYHWEVSHYPWSKDKARELPPRTPSNALLSGPTIGGPWDPNDDAPRSISEEWFDVVCPKSERRIISTHDVKPPIQSSPGDEVFNTWEMVLREAPERCVEVHGAPAAEDSFSQVFDLWLWGSTRVLPLWEGFKNSPVSRLLATSPIVQSAVDRNEYLFRPRGPRPPVSASWNPYDRMLAIHLRRGDYQNACQGFADWNSTFYGWNLLPFLPDKFVHPLGYEWGKSTPEGNKHYLKHCYPNEDAIIEKVTTARDEYIRSAQPTESRYLDVLLLLTNDKTGWVDGLKAKFHEDGWTTVVTTRDLQLDQEQKEVGMAVDMDLARKAAVFIGNGWSSFTSNIVHRRLVDGKEPISTRFF